MGGMDNATIWFIGIAMKIGYEKRESRDGGRDAVEKIAMKYRVMNGMTIGDTQLQHLFCPLFGLRRLGHNGNLVLQ